MLFISYCSERYCKCCCVLSLLHRPPTHPVEFFADPLLMSSSWELCGRSPRVDEDWAIAPDVSLLLLFMSALCYLFVLQDKQHSRHVQARAKQAEPGARHAHTKSILCIVRDEKSVRQPLRSIVCSIPTGHLRPPNMGDLSERPGGAGTHASRKIHDRKCKPGGHHPAAGVAERHVGCAPLQQRWPPEKCDPREWWKP